MPRYVYLFRAPFMRVAVCHSYRLFQHITCTGDCKRSSDECADRCECVGPDMGDMLHFAHIPQSLLMGSNRCTIYGMQRCMVLLAGIRVLLALIYTFASRQRHQVFYLQATSVNFGHLAILYKMAISRRSAYPAMGAVQLLLALP